MKICIYMSKRHTNTCKNKLSYPTTTTRLWLKRRLLTWACHHFPSVHISKSLMAPKASCHQKICLLFAHQPLGDFSLLCLSRSSMLVSTRRTVVSEINFFISRKNELSIRNSKKTQAWTEDGNSVLQLSFRFHLTWKRTLKRCWLSHILLIVITTQYLFLYAGK